MYRQDTIHEVFSAYFKKEPDYISHYGNGHINDTYLVVSDKRYILQRMNTNVFPRPTELMENIIEVTRHIREKALCNGRDADRATLTVVPTLKGENYYVDTCGGYWRLYLFVEGSVTFEKVRNCEDFYNCALAFGEFVGMLSDYPAEKLNIPIPNLHNTPVRYKELMDAVSSDKSGRAEGCMSEIEFASSRKEFYTLFKEAYDQGRIPLRITHNDTKLNNILFDGSTNLPLCVIDLDTVMPGYILCDFGDSVRFGANTSAEDETDLSRVSMDLDLFRNYAEGFIKGCGGCLTEGEIELLPYAPIMITLELGMRFLTDYLRGDVYFKIHRPGHNLERARCQFKLAEDMESKLEQMKIIIQEIID